MTPGPLLQRALGFINTEVGQMLDAIKGAHLDSSTVVILTAKHGQSPQDPLALTRINDGKIMDDLNAAWAAGHPGQPSLVAFSVNDDGMLIWLTNRSVAATTFAKNFLLAYNGNGKGSALGGDGLASSTDYFGNPKPYTSAGLATIHAGRDAANFIGVAVTDDRVPDLIGISQVGTVYTAKKKKIAEHGGDNRQDLDVPIVVAGASIAGGRSVSTSVETTQIAPTILQLLGLNPSDLKAVQIEETSTLPLSGDD